MTFNNMGSYKIIFLPENISHLSDSFMENENIKVWRNREGKLHCEDGPAVIFPNGTLHWCIDGEFHREDGPAVIDTASGIFWYWHGSHYDFEKWCEVAKKSDDEIVLLKIQYGAL